MKSRREILKSAALTAAGSVAAWPAIATAADVTASAATRPQADPATEAGSPGAISSASTTGSSAFLPGQKSPPRKILLYSGWATHNIGDVGHTPGTLRFLTEFLPDAQITCWLYKTNDAVTAMLRRRFPNVPVLTDQKLDNQGKASTPELQKAFDECDILVHNSGMHFNRYWGPPIGLLYAARAKNKSVVLYGQSFDGFRPQEAQTLPKLLSGCASIFTRDDVSLSFLRSQPVTPGVLEFGPDGCFGIDVRDDDRANTFLAAKGLEPRRFVAVIIRSDSAELTGIKPGDTAAEAAAKARLEVWTGKLMEIVCTIARTTKLKIALVPEVEKEIWGAKGLIFDKLPADVAPSVVWRNTWWNVDEACSVYAQAHSLIAMEPHSCIMALAAGTPAIHFFSQAHGSKAYMVRDVGLPEWLIDIDQEPAATVLHAFNRIDSAYDLAKEKVARAMSFVNRRSQEMAFDIGAMRQPLA